MNTEITNPQLQTCRLLRKLTLCIVVTLCILGTARVTRAKTHHVSLGDNIQDAITAAAAGDRLNLAAGLHQVVDTIIVDKSLVIRGVGGNAKQGLMATVIKGVGGLSHVIRVEAGAGSPVEIKDLQVENTKHGIQHRSGACVLRNCRVIMRPAGQFFRAVLLQGAEADKVTVNGCYVLVEAISGIPDADAIFFDVGSIYEEISIINTKVINEIPNVLSVGIEGLNSLAAAIVIRDNSISSKGYGIGIFSSSGTIDIRNNTIWSATIGVTVGTSSLDPSSITDNHVTVDDLGLDIYPAWIRNFAAQFPTACIGLGFVGATITNAFDFGAVVPEAANVSVTGNVLSGNPQYGIALLDSVEPAPYAPTPNDSHDNIFKDNDFTGLATECDIALATSTTGNVFMDNVGVESVCDEGDNVIVSD